jgi:hypothetical protein
MLGIPLATPKTIALAEAALAAALDALVDAAEALAEAAEALALAAAALAVVTVAEPAAEAVDVSSVALLTFTAVSRAVVLLTSVLTLSSSAMVIVPYTNAWCWTTMVCVAMIFAAMSVKYVPNTC